MLIAAAMTSAASIAERLQARPFAWRAAAVVAGAAAMAVASRLEVEIGPVPLTAQTYALFVISGLLGGGLALTAVLLWLAAAALGLPVLAGGAAGIPALTGYTMGFLAGMAAAAWVCGNGAERTATFGRLTLLFLAGHAIVLAAGWAGLALYLDPANAFTSGILPFVPGALVKSLAAAATLRLLVR